MRFKLANFSFLMPVSLLLVVSISFAAKKLLSQEKRPEVIQKTLPGLITEKCMFLCSHGLLDIIKSGISANNYSYSLIEEFKLWETMPKSKKKYDYFIAFTIIKTCGSINREGHNESNEAQSFCLPRFSRRRCFGSLQSINGLYEDQRSDCEDEEDQPVFNISPALFPYVAESIWEQLSSFDRYIFATNQLNLATFSLETVFLSECVGKIRIKSKVKGVDKKENTLGLETKFRAC